MNALKTFLERAKDGGWDDGAMKNLIQVIEMSRPDSLNPEVAVRYIFNPEAAQAVWTNGIGITSQWKHKQYAILTHIQSGKTPLEALEIEL